MNIKSAIKSAFAAAASFLCLGAPKAEATIVMQPNLIVDGEFNNGFNGPTGWAVSGNLENAARDVPDTINNQSTLVLVTGTNGSPTNISQSLSLTPGQAYNYDLFLANPASDTGQYFEITIGNQTLLSFNKDNHSASAAAFGYTEYKGTFTADPNPANPSDTTPVPTIFAIKAQNDFHAWDVDKVVVAPVPEPAVSLLLAGGLAVLARRRRTRAASPANV